MALKLLRFECNRHPACLVAYVAMPDHLHFLFGPRDGQVTKFLARYKPNATRNDGKYSLPIYSPQWINEKIDYIHQNPIRKGLVEQPADYLWSSYLAYHLEADRIPPVPVDLDWENFFE